MIAQNPYKKYESAFEGWPDVRAMKVHGENGMVVGGRHFTPERDKGLDALTVFWAIFWGVIIALAFRNNKDAIWDQAEAWTMAACGLWAALIWFSRLTFRPYLQKPTVVYFSPRHIQIGQRVYDASLQHKFSMDIHRKAADEADAELRAQQRGKSHVRHFKYYRKSFHIYFEYLGQKILVTDISNPEHSEKLLRALVAVDKIMHKEKTVFAANANTEDAAGSYEQKSGAYFGKRPALD
jgi:hypothetical protein